MNWITTPETRNQRIKPQHLVKGPCIKRHQGHVLPQSFIFNSVCGERRPGLLTWPYWERPSELWRTKTFPKRGRWRSYHKALRGKNCPLPTALPLFVPLLPRHGPHISHENHDIAFKYGQNQNTAGKMKEGKAGQPSIPSQSPHTPKFWLCHKGRVNQDKWGRHYHGMVFTTRKMLRVTIAFALMTAFGFVLFYK